MMRILKRRRDVPIDDVSGPAGAPPGSDIGDTAAMTADRRRPLSLNEDAGVGAGL
jgi:hypothetical protein